MKLDKNCIPCFVRQSMEAAKVYAAGDEALQRETLRVALRTIAEADYEKSPPEIAAEYFRRIAALTGVEDPWAEAKRASNEAVRALLPRLRAEIEASPNPLETAVRMAIAGNVIDFGTPRGNRGEDLLDVIEHARNAPLCMDAFAAFERRASEAESILYLADNCGEIVLDRLLIERLGPERVVLAVRGRPILNDVTPADLPSAGLDGRLRVIDNGADVPGTVLSRCTPEFNALFASADLAIAKGQGNYETLDDVGREIFFLMKVKCAVVSDAVGLPVDSLFFHGKDVR